ncbi:MAG: rod shape-determining protein RodA, partial [Candidatus Moranbacteria bacterium]|nr:rod shape-determining protein RodA [Candidatus Moranbacteria bacterium]
SRINYGIWENYAVGFFFISLFLLILVLIFGTEVNNTKGWFMIFDFGIQPAEIAKVAFIILLAKYFSRIKVNDKSFRHLIVSGVYCALPVFLIILQPDYGSALVFIFIWLIILLHWGLKRNQFLVLAILGVLISIFSWFVLFTPRQKDLILTAFDPARDPAGTGYHVLQSMTAIGSGRIYGKGLGAGSQSQLHFLPEVHTDFIFSAIAEELGFLGVLALMLGFIFLFFEMFRIARNSADNFGRFLVEGTMAMFFVQFMVNVGMNLGMFPVVGLPLPLVSYGGSSLIMTFLLLGIITNIHATGNELKGFEKIEELDVTSQVDFLYE